MELADGVMPILDEVAAASEAQLQEKLKDHPELLPLEELGLGEPAIVVGRESQVESGRVDLVVLGNGGELALVEFKTGPQNPDFRECLAQLIDYGSDLWGLSVDEFEARVVRRYFDGAHSPSHLTAKSLQDVIVATWGGTDGDAVDWRERLTAQLRDGDFLYVAVAQRFTPPVLKTLQYLNAVTEARFAAVELVRFEGAHHAAFEARFVAGAQPPGNRGTAAKASLAGVDDFLTPIADDEYRHQARDLLEGLGSIEGLTIFWGTTGCSLRVPLSNRSPLSIGWLFPPGPPRWMGLSDVTLGWYEDANGLALSNQALHALEMYRADITAIGDGNPPSSGSIRGLTFGPSAVVAHVEELREAVARVVAELRAAPAANIDG
ncbi:hypothetical protein JQN72_17865 [Phycicoccus sp. CSK15P-2]|uniref:hypothetical protein n=1 Tax=Phycicoccus sp. CSK15P-2 TaxID=2807627 RepID=UPI00194DD96D|nr:hypothetical protein [Phycicoccus sp. CSK15P-2]MBM6406103.1 hypothetical protein [Phycicoccus sp. CSK15P-2]